jgi:site-specific DNA-cytosine methylase
MIGGPDGPGQREAAYDVHVKIMCPSDHGVPQHRPRLFIAGLLKSARKSPFIWPEPVGCLALGQYLDPSATRPTLADQPPESQKTARRNLRAVLTILAGQRVHPFKTDVGVNVDGSKPNFMVDRVPCLTASRAAAGGHWITSRGRRMTCNEMLRVMAIRPSRLATETVKPRQFRRMVGNAIAVNCLERIFVRLLPAAGIVASSHLPDRWSTPDGQRAALQSLL